MVIWLEGALKSVMPDAKEPLPEEPEFDGVAKPKKPKDDGTKPEPKKPAEKPGAEKPKD